MGEVLVDDLYGFEQKLIKVAENTKGIKKACQCYKLTKKFGKQLKILLCESPHTFIRALVSDLRDEQEIKMFFSKKVGNVLSEIKTRKSLEFLTPSQVVILFVDFIVPIVYEETGISKESTEIFVHCWIINVCKYIWNDTPEIMKKEIFRICYDDVYVEKDLNEIEKITYELEKYPELVFGFQPDKNEEEFVSFLKHRNHVPNYLYAYCVREKYSFNSYGITEKTLHAIFDGLSKEELMRSWEMDKYSKFPDKITIYRGTNATEVVPRLSWSLDRKVAEKFCSGQLFMATISKERILAYFDTDEQEILVWLKPNEIKKFRYK